MSRFSDYLQTTFDFSAHEAEEIIIAMKKPLGKSIRVNTRKIALSEFTIHAKEQGWELTVTDIPEVFLIDREDTAIALGNTLEHQAGWFYIQEVAAAHPPFLLQQEIQKAKGKVQNGGIILDMCAAPGGKTTQLADYFPDSLVIANEVNRTRTPQLFDNLDRMGYDNIAVVSCDGRFFQNFPEFFDAVLLDAPCSGEGTAFRDGAVIDHWHEKNIDRIAKLQKQLMETAETVVKPEGFLSYSTCTLNTLENEAVINSSLERQEPLLFERFRKRFWPHIEHTGGFFASIFQKKSSPHTHHEYPILAAKGQQKLIVNPVTKGEREIVERFISKHLKTKLKPGFLFITKDGVYFNQRNLGPLAQHFYFVHAGMRIGTIKNNSFTPTHHLLWCLTETSHISQRQITRAEFEWKTKNPEKWCIGLYGRGVVGIVPTE
jgi:16S rRNA (cytosine1407-C5)-methyltransferase